MATLIYFTAKWCGPCKALLPYISELVVNLEKNGHTFTIIDVDANPRMVQEHLIQAVPTLICITEKEKTAHSGAPSIRAKITSLIE